MMKYMRAFRYSKCRRHARLIYSYFFDKNVWLLAVFTLGLGLRILGTIPGYFNHPDEPKISQAAANIVFHLDFQPIAYYYGSLLPIILALSNFIILLPLYFLFYLPINFLYSVFDGKSSAISCILNKSLETCMQLYPPNFFHYASRIETAILSSLSIVLVYFVAKRFLNKQVGVIAAFFTATNYRHILSSHLVLADAPLAFFVLLSLLLSLRILGKNNFKNYIFSGIGIGLTLSVKYFYYTIPAFLLCHIIANWKHKSNYANLKQVVFNPKLVLAIAVGLLLFLAINPYTLLDFESFKEQQELNASFYGVSGSSIGAFFNFKKIPLFSVLYLYKYGLGEFMTLATVVGTIIALVRYTKPALVVLSIVFPFFYFFLVISGATYVRNYSAILPLVMVFPAIAVFQLASLVKISAGINVNVKRLFLIITLLIVALLSAIPFKNALVSSIAFAQPRSYTRLENWIMDELPNHVTLAKTWNTPFPGPKQVDVKDWGATPISYQSVSELLGDGFSWFIISSEAGVYVNSLLNLADRVNPKNDAIISGFLDSRYFWEVLENNYASLVIRELASYRIKEFIKPPESSDSSYVVIKLPNFDGYTFNTISPSGPSGSRTSGCYSLSAQSDELVIKPTYLKPGLNVNKFELFTIPVKEHQLYRLRGQVEYKNTGAPTKNFRSKFLRINYYNGDHMLLRTYVSNQVKTENNELVAMTIAPAGSSSAEVVFQLDECGQNGEKYTLSNFKFEESKEQIDLSKYPYFYKKLPKNFIWQPEM